MPSLIERLLSLPERRSFLIIHHETLRAVQRDDKGGVVDLEFGSTKVNIPQEVLSMAGGASLGTIYLARTRKLADFLRATFECVGGVREDQEVVDITDGSLHVLLHCFTNERFLDVLEDITSGKMKERLQKEFSKIGIETEEPTVEIINKGEVEERVAAIKKRKHSSQIIVQGGAYNQQAWNDDEENEYKNAIKNSAKIGYEVLTRGGTAVDAVEAALRVLEDNELFEAGYGSPLSNDGEVECDAMIMDGDTLKSGSVTSARHFRNPVSLAKLIMNKTPHCGLSGEGALKFATEIGFPVISDTKQLISERSKKQKVPCKFSDQYYIRTSSQRLLVQEAGWNSGGDTASAVVKHSRDDPSETVSAVARDDPSETVSAVARDANGHFACAVSTGGIPGKLKGRVSDASMVGCGGYANKHGAATASGVGESIIKMTLAREVVFRMENGRNAQDSAEEALEKMKNLVPDVGGVIAIDEEGSFGRHCSTKMMGWASIKDGTVRSGLDPSGKDVQVEQLNE